MTRPAPLSRLTAFVLAAVATLAVTACELPVQVHGNLPDDADIARLEPGKQGRTDVVNLLGTPSVRSTFKDDTWYYVGVKQTQLAFFSPDIKERNVLVLKFDDRDLLSEKKLYTQADTRSIDPVDRVTPTEGRDLTILQQLLGNVGRFGDSAGGGGLPGPGPGRAAPGN